VRYGDALILEGITLDIHDQEVLCLIGPSGCGKTTLLHVVAGLVAPAGGTVHVGGQPVDRPGPDRVMVFQDDAVFPWMTVWRNVEYGLRLKKVAREARVERVRATIDLVGLTGRETLYPRQLSGGMRKRVDLGRALAVEPEILLMDEPYGSLDAMTKERLQLEFLRIHESTKMTTLFVTHDLEEALFLGDRVVAMGVAPGHVHSILDVGFDHPRPAALKRSDDFQRLRGELAWRLEAAGAATQAHVER
jgi:NitT/TauT family transport system ATP-binding protein